MHSDYTVEASNFADLGNLALFLSGGRLAIIKRVLKKNTRNGSSRKNTDMHTWFHSFFLYRIFSKELRIMPKMRYIS
jgi:hypothetical protein